MVKKRLYLIEAEVCLGDASYGEIKSFYKHASSKAQAVKLVTLELEEKYRTRIYLKDYEVEEIQERKSRKGIPISTPSSSSRLPISTPRSILIQFSKDFNLERREGCFDLSQIKPIIWQGVRAGFFLSIRDLAREGNWEKIAEIIPQDLNVNFNLETEQPLTSPLFT